MKNRIAINIIVLRRRKGKSQEALADDLKITRARLGAWEEERNEPNIQMLIKMSKYFKISVGRLISYKYK